MAIVGLAHMIIAPFESHTDGQMPVYGTGMEATRMVSADLTYERSEVSLEANNVTVESDNAITGGSLSLSGDHFTGEARVMAFGAVKTKGKGDKDVYRTTAKSAPYLGCGVILVEQLDGVVTYRAVWIYRTQFGPQGISARTKGKNTEYQTTTVTGKFMGVRVDENEPSFIEEAEFDTEGAAVDWLKTWANMATV